MKAFVVSGIKGLMAQKITVGSCLIKRPISLIRFLTDGNRIRSVGIGLADGLNKCDHPVIGKISILPALQHESAKAKLVSGYTTIKNLLVCQPVPVSIFVAFANTAVETIVAAVIGKFNKTPDIDIMTVEMMALSSCQQEELFGKPGGSSLNQCGPFFTGKRMFRI